jgi:hypothetical protein
MLQLNATKIHTNNVKVEGEEPSEIFGKIMLHICANMHCIVK